MNNGRARIVQFAAAIIGTVLISLLGAWFTFGSEQAEQLVRLEAQENEAGRQRQIDQATVQALNEALRSCRPGSRDRDAHRRARDTGWLEREP